jgi:hypothetical protein
MINLTAAELGGFILILSSSIGLMAYMVGYFIGNQDEKKKIIDFHETHEMTLTEELIKNLYPLYPFTKKQRS